MDNLLKQIEDVRKQLNKLIEEEADKNVILKKSQELDILINDFYKKKWDSHYRSPFSML